MPAIDGEGALPAYRLVGLAPDLAARQRVGRNDDALPGGLGAGCFTVVVGDGVMPLLLGGSGFTSLILARMHRTFREAHAAHSIQTCAMSRGTAAPLRRGKLLVKRGGALQGRPLLKSPDIGHELRPGRQKAEHHAPA